MTKWDRPAFVVNLDDDVEKTDSNELKGADSVYQLTQDDD